MLSRREALRGGFGALSVGLFGGLAWGRLPGDDDSHGPNPWPCLPLRRTRPFAPVPRNPQSVIVQGLPFLRAYTGDSFNNEQMPFHRPEAIFPNDTPPSPTEQLDVAIIGGGLSGLAAAYLLRRFDPVVFELHERFGGVAQGEEWASIPYSLGGAYFIAPDEGSELEALYRELGLDRAYRLSPGGDPIELNGQILDDFWSGAGRPPAERVLYERYRGLVLEYGENYPEIPLIDGQDNAWIIELDQITFQQHVESRLGGPLPVELASAIQGYFFSSFGTGWERISAAAGWNFVAAEEFGRWVLPGGNAYVIDELWSRLARRRARHGGDGCPPLRGGCKVIDVRRAAGGRVQVTWVDPQGGMQSLLARRVVVACPKHVAKHMIHGLETWDAEKRSAMEELQASAYLVVNVLLDARLDRDFYDLFLLGDGRLPMDSLQVESQSRFIDVINANFALRNRRQRNSVLTLYWPLPWPTARRLFMTDDDWPDFAGRLAPQIHALLDLFQLSPSAVRQVRMTRWGHAMPVAAPGVIASGLAEKLRRPVDDVLYFINQDNWALPAFETCLLEALHYAPRIAQGL